MNRQIFILLIGTVLLMQALTITSTDIYVPFIEQISREVPGSVEHPGDIIGLVLLGEGLGALLWGFLFDRYGFRRTIVPGCIAFIIACWVLSFTENNYLFYFARFFQGCTRSLIYVTGYAMIRYYADERSYTTLVNLMTGVIIILPPLSVALASELAFLPGTIWREISWIITTCSLAIFAAFMLLALHGVETPKMVKTPVSGAQVLHNLYKTIRNDYRIFICMSIISIPSIAWIGALCEDPSILSAEEAHTMPGTFSEAVSHFVYATGEHILLYPHNIYQYFQVWIQGSCSFLTSEEANELLAGANVDLMITLFISCIFFAIISKIYGNPARLLTINVALLCLGSMAFWLTPFGAAFNSRMDFLFIIFPFLLICYFDSPTQVLMEGVVILDESSKGEYGIRLAFVNLFSSIMMFLYLHFDDEFWFRPGFNGLAVFFTGASILLLVCYLPVLRRNRGDNI